MALVRIKTKYQVTLPHQVRQRVGVAVGDMLEAKVERGKITLTPKSVIDRRLAEALEDVKHGRVYGRFTTHEEFIASLHGQAKKLRSKKSK